MFSPFYRLPSDETEDAPRRDVATQSPSDAPTAPDACPRIRQSRSLSSETSSRLLPSEISPRPRSTTVCDHCCCHQHLSKTHFFFPFHHPQPTLFLSCTPSCTTAFPAPFTQRLCEIVARRTARSARHRPDSVRLSPTTETESNSKAAMHELYRSNVTSRCLFHQQ